MIELTSAAIVLAAFEETIASPLRRLRGSLPAESRPDGPSLEIFDGGSVAGTGLSAFVVARRPDTRVLCWQGEMWMRPDPVTAHWSATVKGGIDLDDEEGEPQCVLNEQRTVANAEHAAAAIRELSRLVADYPIPELLAQ